MTYINNHQRDILFKAFGTFLEAMRDYFSGKFSNAFGVSWPKEYERILNSGQLQNWQEGIAGGINPKGLIDYPHLKQIAIQFKEHLRSDFKNDVTQLPTHFETMKDVRDKLAHFQDINQDEYNDVFIQMKKVLGKLKLDELKAELSLLQDGKPEASTKKAKPSPTLFQTQPWFNVVKPHSDIAQGRLDESVFAANLSEVALGSGPEVYNNPVLFFSKTHITEGLKNLAKRVVMGLNGDEEADNRTIQLQTNFGGGKTHSLISLLHLCKNGNRLIEGSQVVNELFNGIAAPKFEKANIAVFTNATNDVSNGRRVGDLHIQTLWGELAYQLCGKDGFEIVQKNDKELISPSSEVFKQVLIKAQPALILIDELTDYCVKASARVVGKSTLGEQTVSFMQALTEAVTQVKQAVSVVTLPSSAEEAGTSDASIAMLTSLSKRVGRLSNDTMPVSDDEIYQVIRRRLFDFAGNEEDIVQVASQYVDFYQTIAKEVPSNASKSNYKDRIQKSYPFHPELIDIFKNRWASSSQFQRTRGVLRLLALLVSDLWKRKDSLSGGNLLIQTSDVNLDNLEGYRAQIQRLYGNGFSAVLSADVLGSISNSAKLDLEKNGYGSGRFAQTVTSCILLNTIGADGANKGVSVQELKLQLLSPNGINHNTVNTALDDLEACAYYLYYAQNGNQKRYWFHIKPNLNILINQAKSDISTDEIYAEVIRRIKDKTKSVQHFNILVDPSTDVSEQKKLTLIILNPRHTYSNRSFVHDTQTQITSIATKKGSTARTYANTILFLLPSEEAMLKLNELVRVYLAAVKVNSEYIGQLETEQKHELKKKIEDSSKILESGISTAYSVVAKHHTREGIKILILTEPKDSLDSQIDFTLKKKLIEEEWLLEGIGINLMQRLNVFPTPEKSIRLTDCYESFLRYNDFPMILNESVFSNSILLYCLNKQFCIGSGDGKTWNKIYFGETIPFLKIDDESYWILDKSSFVEPSVSPQPIPTPIPRSENPLQPPVPLPPVEPLNKINRLTVSGDVSLEHYTELFRCFIAPFTKNGHKVDISINFTIKSSESNSLEENSPLVNAAKEAAMQLGLRLMKE
ncbi:MAG: DUF499 domain-containing protein [Chloroherpetonaceae bacterium]|nr:DUF499 domain-containing protein [Chloroherpetonaceae bacterium]